MRECSKTLVMAAVAIVLILLAVFALPGRETREDFAHQQTAFYAAFDPMAITSVEVVDHADGTTRTFLVEKAADGNWVIPSHENYPADSKRQLDRTAGILNGLKRGAIRGRLERDFASFGVGDPTEGGYTGDEYGKRVIVKANGNILCDLVIGKAVEGTYGWYYVRKPDSTDVYTAKLDAANISTRFADWVETDLLQLDGAEFKEITASTYGLQGALDPRTRMLATITKENEVAATISRDDSDWAMPAIDTTVEEFQKDEASSIASELNSLTLVGVRHKPSWVVDLLNGLADGERKYESDRADEIGRGFYVSFKTDGTYRTFGGNGQTIAKCDDGVVYRLNWGSGIVGEADEVSAAPEDGEETLVDSSVQEDTGLDEGTGSRIVEHRFLWIDAEFDESLLGVKPVPPTKPEPAAEADDADEETSPATEADEETGESGEASDDSDDAAEYEKALKAYESDRKAYEEKVRKGQERVKKLQRKFNEWYYVVSADAFEKVHFERSALVKPKPEPETDDPEPGDEPSTDNTLDAD